MPLGKKIIMNGKLFDRSKAEVVYYRASGEAGVDSHWSIETLYHTDNGAFVLVAEGGRASRYAGDGRDWPGYKVMVMTTGKVIEWAEYNEIEPDVILKYTDIPAL